MKTDLLRKALIFAAPVVMTGFFSYKVLEKNQSRQNKETEQKQDQRTPQNQ